MTLKFTTIVSCSSKSQIFASKTKTERFSKLLQIKKMIPYEILYLKYSIKNSDICTRFRENDPQSYDDGLLQYVVQQIFLIL